MPLVTLHTPFLTPECPGTGGRIKVRPEDFEVEEIPSYEPCGSGEHLYLWIEKTGVGAEFLARMIAQRLNVPVGTIGIAGMKDRHAVTRQWISVPATAEPNVKRLDSDDLRILLVNKHTNKLKPGHLQGNRFRILIREADRNADVDTILNRFRTTGMPNYYGPQRFGRDGETAKLGFDCLLGRSRQRLRPFLFKLALSAAQSVLFNLTLTARQVDGLLRTVLPGDVMMKWPRGGIFVAEDVAIEQARFDTRETVTGGPMFGSRMFSAKDDAARREAKVLSDHGLSLDMFGKFGQLATGTRRHNLIYIDDLSHQWEADGLRLSFSLPSGSYATVLLKDVMKVDLNEPSSEGDGTDES